MSTETDVFKVGNPLVGKEGSGITPDTVISAGSLDALALKEHLLECVFEPTSEMPPAKYKAEPLPHAEPSRLPAPVRPSVWAIGNERGPNAIKIQAARQTLAKDDTAVAINDLADLIAAEVSLLHHGKQLYVRRGSVYHPLDEDDFAILIQHTYPHEPTFAAL